jgi:hypothetical protein
MKKISIFWLILLTLNIAVYCEQVRNKIELKDGSVINGQIVSYANGVYTINTDTLGEIKVEAAKISKIESINTPLTNTAVNSIAQTGNLTQSQMDSYKQALMNDPKNAAIIAELAADPQIQELAKDPQIVDAAKAGDIGTLMKNEKFMNTVRSRKVKESIKELNQ